MASDRFSQLVERIIHKYFKNVRFEVSDNRDYLKESHDYTIL